VLPPVDDLRQAALYLPYALLPSDADAALAAKARGAQRGGPVITCMHSLAPCSAAAPACTAAAARGGTCLAAGPADPQCPLCVVAWCQRRLRCTRAPAAVVHVCTRMRRHGLVWGAC